LLRHVLFDLSLFATEAERANSQKRVLCLLEALVWCNRYWLQQHPETPLIYQSGIEYKLPAQQQAGHDDYPEVAKVRAFLKSVSAPSDVTSAFSVLAGICGGGETFREIPRIRENGGGDCDNVSSWRVAELRELGIWARPYITWRKREDGGTTYHVIVRYEDGTSEDPSLLLGMGGAEKAADRAEEERKLAERTDDFINGISQRAGVVLGSGPPQWMTRALRKDPAPQLAEMRGLRLRREFSRQRRAA
jgi:hypothetical protein